MQPETRRAALIATAVTVPLVIVAALLIGRATTSGTSSPSSSPGAALPAVSVSAPPVTDDKTVATCASVISALPLTLAGANLRRTTSNPPSPSIVAWGDPAIVLRCGVHRPSGLTANSGRFVVTVDGVNFLPDKQAGGTLFTVIDRAVYLDVYAPSSYAQPPLGPIADAIAKVLRPVCQAQITTGTSAVPTSELCTRRK